MFPVLLREKAEEVFRRLLRAFVPTGAFEILVQPSGPGLPQNPGPAPPARSFFEGSLAVALATRAGRRRYKYINCACG